MNNNYTSVSCIGYNIFTDNLSNIKSNDKLVINTINQYSYCIAEENDAFKQALLSSDILLPDGVGITTAVKLITGKKIKKIAGADIHSHFLNELNKNGGRCFYMGSSDATLEKIKARLVKDYPNVDVMTYSPPFKDKFSEQENNELITAINAHKPDVLFVGMTAPKQELWVRDNAAYINAKAICSIGAVFDFYAGTIERANQFWINMGLEWFVRLVKNPKKMSKRYLYYGPIYASMLLKQKLSNKFA
jgi:N-acetylglucosaminyldiphosphoundecaprenol N-acetyl-beta-D-mannosaminyltransferase